MILLTSLVFRISSFAPAYSILTSLLHVMGRWYNMTYGTDSRPESYHISAFSHMCIRNCVAYEGQRVAEQHEAGRMVRQLVGEALYVGVYFVVYGPYLKRLLVDLVWRAEASAPS
jgi:hypothetical protein